MALLVALDARLTPFFAVLIVVGLVMVAVTPLLAGSDVFVLPRFDRRETRALLTRALPLAAALVLGQLYFRLVILLMSLVSNPRQTGYFGVAARDGSAGEHPDPGRRRRASVLAAAARDDRARLRYAIEGLSEGR